MTQRTASRLPQGGSIAVVRGAPTETELAAVVMAIDAAGVAKPPVERSAPAWLSAARSESVGGRPAASPADLQAARLAFGAERDGRRGLTRRR